MGGEPGEHGLSPTAAQSQFTAIAYLPVGDDRRVVHEPGAQEPEHQPGEGVPGAPSGGQALQGRSVATAARNGVTRVGDFVFHFVPHLRRSNWRTKWPTKCGRKWALSHK